jgi:hypothetical protein
MPMGMARDEDVDIHLPGHPLQCRGIIPGDDLVSVDKTNTEGSVGDNLAHGKAWGLGDIHRGEKTA